MLKITDVANYFLSLVDSDAEDCISNLKLQKLCYYAQGFHLALYGEPLFRDNIEAWQHGPVVPSLYRTYKDNGSSCLMVSKDFDPNTIPDDEKELLTDIYEEYGQYSAWRLRDMTHQEDPWIDAYNRKNNVISNNELTTFFKTRIIE